MENLLPLEYCKLDRAARLLGCEIEDLIHWGAIGAIELSVYLVKPIKCWLRHVPDDDSCDPLIVDTVMINNGIANYIGINSNDEINCFCGGIWNLSRKAIECLECSVDGVFAISADVLSASDSRGQFIVRVMFDDDLIIKPSFLLITKNNIKTVQKYLNKEEIPNIYNNPELAKKAKDQEQPQGQSNRPHHRSESTAINREQVLAAAVNVREKYPNECPNFSKWAQAVVNHSRLYWPDLEEPPLTMEKIERIIASAMNDGKPDKKK